MKRSSFDSTSALPKKERKETLTFAHKMEVSENKYAKHNLQLLEINQQA